MVDKIEICLQYFLEENYQKQPLCGAKKGAMNETQPEKKMMQPSLHFVKTKKWYITPIFHLYFFFEIENENTAWKIVWNQKS